ncbi:hypothetical protein H0516_03470 [Pantoea stewartii]|nr:hypothetical protein [Pantoea stewartii]
MNELNGIRWQYDIHGRTTEKDNGQTRWRYRYDPLGEASAKPVSRCYRSGNLVTP